MTLHSGERLRDPLRSPVSGRSSEYVSEVQEISTRARRRRLGSQRGRGGLFPLPHCAELLPHEGARLSVPELSAPRYACQRRRRRILRTQRVNTQVDALNRLACATSTFGPIGHVEPSFVQASAAQSECLSGMMAKNRRAGRPPVDLSPSSALKELLQAKDLYSQEPQHLASYDPSRLKILQARARPREAITLLPTEEGLILGKPNLLALGSEELEELSQRSSMPVPYWDPALKVPKARKDFKRQLAAVGLLVGCEVVHSEVGFFCVKKKGDKQRLIVDARMTIFVDAAASQDKAWLSRCHG